MFHTPPRSPLSASVSASPISAFRIRLLPPPAAPHCCCCCCSDSDPFRSSLPLPFSASSLPSPRPFASVSVPNDSTGKQSQPTRRNRSVQTATERGRAEREAVPDSKEHPKLRKKIPKTRKGYGTDIPTALSSPLAHLSPPLVPIIRPSASRFHPPSIRVLGRFPRGQLGLRLPLPRTKFRQRKTRAFGRQKALACRVCIRTELGPHLGTVELGTVGIRLVEAAGTSEAEGEGHGSGKVIRRKIKRIPNGFNS